MLEKRTIFGTILINLGTKSVITPVYFYKTSLGNEPVREWLKEFNQEDKKTIGDDLQTVQIGWKAGLIREPLVKCLGHGLFELRSSLPSHRIARLFFCTDENQIVLLHGFIKKTQKTPVAELVLAQDRQDTLKVKR